MLQFIQDKNIENSHFEAFQTLPIGRIRIAWVRTSQTLKYSAAYYTFYFVCEQVASVGKIQPFMDMNIKVCKNYVELDYLVAEVWNDLLFLRLSKIFWTLQLEIHPALQNAYHVFPFSINLFLQCTFHPLSFVYMLFCAFSLYSFGPNCFCSCRCYKVICFFMTMLLK